MRSSASRFVLPLLYLPHVLGLGIVTLFVWLQLHNQRQSGYLIYYDFWRNYAALRNHQAYPFFFHNVHTWIVESAVWFLDVLLVGGTLTFLHAYVCAATLLAVGLLSLHIRRMDLQRNAPLATTVLSVIALTAIWVSPANGMAFAYPGVDVLAASVFLWLPLAEAFHAKLQRADGGSFPWMVGFFLVITVGICISELFLAALLFYAVVAWRHGRTQLALAEICIVLASLVVYLACLRRMPVVFGLETTRSPAALLHNFLVLLSSHFGVLLSALGAAPRVAASVSAGLSVLQLVCFARFVIRRRSPPGQNPYPSHLPSVLAAFAVAALSLATWLRYGELLMYDPVDRYTWYAGLFSIAVILAARTHTWAVKDRATRALNGVIVALTIAYSVVGAGQLWLHSHNAAGPIISARLEMPVYASSPGYESSIGPSAPNGGADFRADLHAFVKQHRWAVFSSPGYRSLGGQLIGGDTIDGTRCVQLATRESQRRDRTYQYVDFAGVDGNGIFVVLDQDRMVSEFSFASKASPFDRAVTALLRPARREQTTYFAKPEAGQLKLAVHCRR